MLNTQFGREKQKMEKRRMGNCRRRKSSSSWSDLYPEIIASISQHLKTRFDILSFRGVCKQWRGHSVLPPASFLSPLLPYRFLTTSDTLPYILGCSLSDTQLDLFVKSIYLITPINIESEASPTCLLPWMVMATEREPGKIQLRHPLTGEHIEHLPEALDLTQFRVSELAQDYGLLYIYSTDRVRKVILCSSSASPSLSDYTAILLDHHDELSALTLSEDINPPRWSEPRGRDGIDFKIFDDVASFKGIYVAVDPHGKLLSIEYEAEEESSPLVVTGILAAENICDHKGRRKRLVVNPLSDKLFLVERVHIAGVRFRVYQFNEECNRWDKVEALCHHSALFVGVRHCFFAPTSGYSGCPVNCIIFVTGSFPRYPGYRRSYCEDLLFSNQNTKERIGVYHLGKRQHKFSFISDYPELLQMMEPPPACFSTSEWESNEDEEMQPCSNSQHNSSQSNEDEEEVQSDSNSRDDRSLHNDKDEDEVQSESNSEDDPPKSQEQTNERPSTSAAQGDATRTPTMNNVEHLAEEETPRKEIIHSAIVGSPTSLTQSNKSNTSTVNFEGLDIRSDLVPTLEKIWSKHGNIVENSGMHNGDMVSRGLELLANVVRILESNSARSLTGSQADYLSSALSDLQCIRFHVDWLAPTVEKAVALQKSKPLVDSFSKLSQSKARVAERISKLIDELAENYKCEKKIEEDLARMSKLIPFSGEVDFDQPLGGGL